MSDFANTIDTLGDEAVMDAIIMRTITEIKDNCATFIGVYAFYNCTALTAADFPEATYIGVYAFRGCVALITADFPAATSIGGSAFYGCNALTALILRNTEQVCELGGTSAFTNTPIASGTGYIYVPAALVDSYKAAAMWSTYADQIRAIEDYPDICGGEST